MEFSRTPLPSSWFELRRLIVESIERTIGQPLAPTEDHDASVYVADFDPGHGMSAGHVHLAWWLKTGIPIVIDRWAKHALFCASGTPVESAHARAPQLDNPCTRSRL